MRAQTKTVCWGGRGAETKKVRQTVKNLFFFFFNFSFNLILFILIFLYIFFFLSNFYLPFYFYIFLFHIYVNPVSSGSQDIVLTSFYYIIMAESKKGHNFDIQGPTEKTRVCFIFSTDATYKILSS